MKFYTIFDDFGDEAASIIRDAGIELTIHPMGKARPDKEQMQRILEEYDGVVIGTSQKITEDMFANVDSPRVIATASIGVDHIRIPEEKKEQCTILRCTDANAPSVAEYTIGCAIACCRRFTEGRMLYGKGENNKRLHAKPVDAGGKTIGVIGAGPVARCVIEKARAFDMDVLCWTREPGKHVDLWNRQVVFTKLKSLVQKADIISVNLPNVPDTKQIISADIIKEMREDAVFISVSRKEQMDIPALFKKAENNPGFYVCLDLDVDENIVSVIPDIPNVSVTPHIAGGTVESRKRMFADLARQIAKTAI